MSRRGSVRSLRRTHKPRDIPLPPPNSVSPRKRQFEPDSVHHSPGRSMHEGHTVSSTSCRITRGTSIESDAFAPIVSSLKEDESTWQCRAQFELGRIQWMFLGSGPLAMNSSSRFERSSARWSPLWTYAFREYTRRLGQDSIVRCTAPPQPLAWARPRPDTSRVVIKCKTLVSLTLKALQKPPFLCSATFGDDPRAVALLRAGHGCSFTLLSEASFVRQAASISTARRHSLNSDGHDALAAGPG
jgi:hypothetical protein